MTLSKSIKVFQKNQIKSDDIGDEGNDLSMHFQMDQLLPDQEKAVFRQNPDDWRRKEKFSVDELS